MEDWQAFFRLSVSRLPPLRLLWQARDIPKVIRQVSGSKDSKNSTKSARSKRELLSFMARQKKTSTGIILHRVAECFQSLPLDMKTISKQRSHKHTMLSMPSVSMALTIAAI